MVTHSDTNDVRPYAVVIGGMNLDICGRSTDCVVDRDSNPGMVSTSAGGVGHNIAQNLAQLGVPVQLITVYGDDDNGRMLATSCARHGIGLQYAARLKRLRSSTYLFITDETGDMLLGVNDMGICNEITPQFLESRLDYINNAAVCIVEANLPEETLAWIGTHVTAPLFGDTVSTVKAHHFDPLLPYMNMLKPNHLEASGLTGIDVRDEFTARDAAVALLSRGVRTVCISMGALGMMCATRVRTDGTLTTNADEFITELVPPYPTDIRTANGAGDAGMAAIAWSWIDNPHRDLVDVGRISQAASSIALECTRAVPDITVPRIRMKMAGLSTSHLTAEYIDDHDIDMERLAKQRIEAAHRRKYQLCRRSRPVAA